MLKPRSLRTHVLAAGCALLAWGASAAPARAQSPEEAALSKGYNDYFDALVAGKAKNRSEMQKLREQLIQPAVRGLNKSIDQKWRQAIRAQAQQPPAERGPEEELLFRRLAQLQGPELPEPAPGKAPILLYDGPAYSGSGSNPAPPAPTLRPIPQPGLDGSKVPKLLEFGQKPPKKK